MLVDPKLVRDGFDDPILCMISNGRPPCATRVEKGVYLTPHFSFDSLISKRGGNLRPDDEWAEGSWEEDFDIHRQLPKGLRVYGVHDSVDAFLADFRCALEASPYEWCVRLTEVRKSEQSPTGGWRWHKWGSYVGKREPQYEYLYDEPDIDSVVVFRLYQRRERAPGSDE